jgi:putative aldouronate transport system substrate-binding protein
MLKKILVVLLSVSLLASVTGCAKNNNTNTDTNTSTVTNTNTNATGDSKEEPYTLTIAWPVYGDSPQDLPLIQEKASEITLKEINMKLELKPVSVTVMPNTYSLAVSSGEKLDIMSTCPTVNVVQYAHDNMIIPLDDLIAQYGSDIVSGLGDTMKAGLISGKQYVIPTKSTITPGTGFIMLDSIVRKYNIDVTKIKTLDDLDPIFEKVSAGEPDMTMFFPFGVSAYLLDFEGLGAGLENNGVGNSTYTNVFETEKYKQVLKKMREWYQKGYISKDFATIQSNSEQLMDAGKLFCGIGGTSDLQLSMGKTVPKVEVTIIEPVNKGSGGGAYAWAIPITAKNPEKSIQFMNLVFKNQDLANLLQYGIEGVHYTKNSDGTIDTTINKTYNTTANIWGDPDKYYVKSSDLIGVGGSIEKYNAVKEAWNKRVKTSEAYGFVADTSNVKNELAAINTAQDQYLKLLEGGALDPDKYLPLMNEKMYEAGLQKVIDDMQKQLDDWKKTQN